jgi:uncharacterized protein YodC (DUF2158 family)
MSMPLVVGPGSRVRLQIGGPEMSVERAFDQNGRLVSRTSEGNYEMYDIYEIECVWVDDQEQIKTRRFLAEMLQEC